MNDDREAEVLSRVRSRLQGEIVEQRIDERRVRRAVIVGVAGFGVIAAVGSAGIASVALPRSVEAGVACYDTLDTSGPLHEAGLPEGQILPTDPAERAQAVRDICGITRSALSQGDVAVCVRPDGLWVGLPLEQGTSESDVCSEVGFSAAVEPR